MTSFFFLIALLAIGYLLYWTIINDRNSPDAADLGWFATRRAPRKTTIHPAKQKTER